MTPAADQQESAAATSAAREEAVRTSHALAVAGLTDMVWGHASIRDRRAERMTASGWGFDEVDAHRVLLVTSSGEVRHARGNGISSTRQPDISCVVHTHAPALAAFASLRPPCFTSTGALIATTDLGRAPAEQVGKPTQLAAGYDYLTRTSPDGNGRQREPEGAPS